MKNKFLTIGTIIIMIIIGLSGCIEETENKNKIKTPLNKLALTIDDVNEEFEIYGDPEHITEPYIAPKDLLYEGWKIFEKYKITFLKNETRFIINELAKLESKEKTKEFITYLRTNISELRYDFTETEIETIGDESYFGYNNTIINEIDVTLYFLCFRIEEAIVVIQTSGVSKDTIINYGDIIADNIFSKINK